MDERGLHDNNSGEELVDEYQQRGIPETAEREVIATCMRERKKSAVRAVARCLELWKMNASR